MTDCTSDLLRNIAEVLENLNHAKNTLGVTIGDGSIVENEDGNKIGSLMYDETEGYVLQVG